MNAAEFRSKLHKWSKQVADDNKKKPNPWQGRHEWTMSAGRVLVCDGKPVCMIQRVEANIGNSDFTVAPAEADYLADWILERLQVESILSAMLSGGVVP